MSNTTRKLIVLLTIIALVLGITPTQSQAAPPQGNAIAEAMAGETPTANVIFKPWHSTATVSLSDTAVLKFGWVACTKGLLKDWQWNSLVTVTVRQGGTILQSIRGAASRAKWAPIKKSDYPTTNCIYPAKTTYLRWWTHNEFPFDSVGIYEVHTLWRLRRPTIDGFDIDPIDGLADWYGGVITDNTVTVTVTP